jgi:20S proteasome alpha/beta subunit
MTLVLALCAQDGVVLASDGQATTASGMPTRTVVEKLDILHGRIAYGCAGPAGMRQWVVDALEKEFTTADLDASFDDLRKRLHQVVNGVQKKAENAFIRHRQFDEAPVFEMLFAGFSANEPWIYEVSREGLDERHWVGEAIGQGCEFATYARVSAEHYRLNTHGLARVRLLAYRAVDDAIRTDAGGLALPIHMAQVTDGKAERLPPDQIERLNDAVSIWQNHEREVFMAQDGDLVAGAAGPADAGIEPKPVN